jgi:DME family drug/metabolite transporter
MRSALPARDAQAGVASVLMAALLWGTIGPAQALTADLISPGALAGWRHLVGGLALVMLGLSHLPSLRRGGRPLAAAIVTTGLVGAAYQTSFLLSISKVGAALGTVVGVATVPLFSGLAARWTSGEQITRRWALGSGCAALGCGVLLLPGAGSRVDLIGVGWGVLAGALFAAYTVTAQRMAAHPADVKVTTGLSMLSGAVVLSPLMLSGHQNLADPAAVAVIAWLGLAATALAYALYSAGLRRVTASTAGTLSLGEPLAAALLSTALLGERLSPSEWLGCSVIFGGLLVAVTGRRRPVPAPDVSVVAMGYVRMPVGVPLNPGMIGRRDVQALGRAAVPATVRETVVHR